MNKENTWRAAPDPIPESDIARTEYADIIVIGLGYSGTAVTRAAAEGGKKVIAIEARKEKNNKMFGSDIANINSKFMESRGVDKVDVIEFFNDWQMRCNNRSNPRLVMQFARNSGKDFDWMLEPAPKEFIEKIHIKHIVPPKHFEGDINGIRFWTGTAFIHQQFGVTTTELMQFNLAAAREHGAETFYETKGYYLLKDGPRVTGVIAKQSDGQYIRLMAKDGVVLAAGDFSGNPAMVSDLCDELTTLLDEGETLKGAGWDGSGIQMGIWAGGRMAPGPICVMGGNYFYPNGVIGNAAVLWLDDEGKRFCNEGFGGDMVFSALEGARLPGGKVTAIFDSNIFDQLEYQSIGHCAMDTSETDPNENFGPILLETRMKKAREAGKDGFTFSGHGFANGRSNKVTIYAADSYEELADRLGFEGEKKENFLSSVNRYNKLAHSGRDEDFGKDVRILFPLDQGPFYAFQKEMYVGNEFLCTVDGLWTDDNQNVLDSRKKGIPGLYATGNCCGRRWGIQYSTSIGGLSIGMAWTLGAQLGRYLAKL